MRVKTGGAPKWRASRTTEARQRARDMARTAQAWQARHGFTGTVAWVLTVFWGIMTAASLLLSLGDSASWSNIAQVNAAWFAGALALLGAAQWRARRAR